MSFFLLLSTKEDILKNVNFLVFKWWCMFVCAYIQESLLASWPPPECSMHRPLPRTPTRWAAAGTATQTCPPKPAGRAAPISLRSWWPIQTLMWAVTHTVWCHKIKNTVSIYTNCEQLALLAEAIYSNSTHQSVIGLDSTIKKLWYDCSSSGVDG